MEGKKRGIMNAAGIICEYNPLHDGHARHMRLARAQTGADTLICVMSGAFVQRGQPAIFDPFIRARWAIAAGADAVVLLPGIYALSAADVFARGGMMTLDAMGIIRHISFGAQHADIQLLSDMAAVIDTSDEAFHTCMQRLQSQGTGYPAALTEAFCRFAPEHISSQDARAVLQSANDTLGLRYILENNALANPFNVAIVQRNPADVTATRIRESIAGGMQPSTLSIPPFACKDLAQKRPCDPGYYDNILIAHLRMMPRKTLDTIADMSQTLCDTLYQAAHKYSSMQDILNHVSGRHITRARVRRALWLSFFGITVSLRQQAKVQVPYLRVLAIKKGREDILRALAHHARVPVLTTGETKNLTEFGQACAQLDMHMLNIRAMCSDTPACGAWYTAALQKIDPTC